MTKHTETTKHTEMMEQTGMTKHTGITKHTESFSPGSASVPFVISVCSVISPPDRPDCLLVLKTMGLRFKDEAAGKRLGDLN